MALAISAFDPNELETSSPERADTLANSPTEENDVGQDVRRDGDGVVDTIAEPTSTLTPRAIAPSGQVKPEIPESYREIIGPVVQDISFGQRFRDFEAEPIDDSWAHAMEAGINNFVAVHGPGSGEVFEFVQCRSSNCVLAGYTIHGQEPHGASVIGELGRQPWWQGGQAASSTYGSGDNRTSFVVLIPRFDE